jgi:hypothetical protein
MSGDDGGESPKNDTHSNIEVLMTVVGDDLTSLAFMLD